MGKLKNILLAILMLIALPALAGPFEPSAGDASMKLIGDAFAGLLPGTTGGGPLAEVMKIFCGGVLFVGGLIVGYTLIIGTLQTAHDGEMMGKRWSSIWLPLRTALGIGLMVPVGGFCVAQMAVGWVAVQGIGLADRAWEAYATSAIAKQDTALQPHTPRVDAFAGQILASLVCVESINKVIAQTPQAAAMGATPAGISVSHEDDALSASRAEMGVGEKVVKNTVLNFGGGAVSQAACGQITFENKIGGGWVFASGDGGFMGIKFVGLQRQIVPPTATEASHRQATAALIEGLRPLAHAVVYADQGLADAVAQKSALSTATAAYKKAVISAAMSEAKSNGSDDMASAMAEDGWMLAGSWFLGIVKVQNNMNGAIEAVPQAHAGKPDTSIFSDELDRAQIRLDSLLKTTGAGKYAIQTYSQAKGGKAPDESSASAVNSIVKAISNLDLAGLSTDPRNPLIIAKEIGDGLLGWAGASFAALAAVSIFVGPFSGLIGPFISMLLFAGVGAGVLLSLFTPFIPYLIWTGALMGWLILLVEAIVAAPLLALAKLDPGGDGMLGSSRSGYFLLLSLFLRPALMVVGMIFALLLLGPVGRFINSTALDALTMTNGSGMIWIFQTLGGVFVYASVLIAALHSLFSLVHAVPDKLMRWIGGGHESSASGHADSAEQRGKTIVGGVAQSSQGAINNASNSPGKPGGPSGQKPKGAGPADGAGKPMPENKSTTSEKK